jgi:hypothetical protein
MSKSEFKRIQHQTGQPPLPERDPFIFGEREWSLAREVVPFVIEASDLHWKPGAWPTRVILPSGEMLRPIASNAERVIYAGPTVQLTVLND